MNEMKRLRSSQDTEYTEYVELTNEKEAELGQAMSKEDKSEKKGHDL